MRSVEADFAEEITEADNTACWGPPGSAPGTTESGAKTPSLGALLCRRPQHLLGTPSSPDPLKDSGPRLEASQLARLSPKASRCFSSYICSLQA